ncbi:hypothetical protein NHP190003_00030 [Helicobacter sp. NHP19-003]|uniref:Beta-lactamase n=1 Tax=Helicobacter gastrocanis TaxID=2849641 RepID=A0ABN6HZ72_9HELI|nr:hypothetical protein [Helicobacter sp. NHP19-003]BCZ16721.1 hypothetical protein NHP190003_00030 [Helicobacter sp. NHP19-003]
MLILKKLALCLGLLTLLHAEEGVGVLVQKGMELERFGYNKDALVLYTRAQQGGDLLATAFVGKMYLGGWGVKRDSCRAVGYFELVINHAHSNKELAMLVAKVGLASAYAEGACVSADSEKALNLIKDVLLANGADYTREGSLRVENLRAGDFSATPLRREYIGLAFYLLGNGMNPQALSSQMVDIDTLKKAAEFGNENAKRELQIAGMAHQDQSKQSKNDHPATELAN